jgi:hypothetical protein
MAEPYHGTLEKAKEYLDYTGGYSVDDCIYKAVFYIRIGDRSKANECGVILARTSPLLKSTTKC